ncbi:hypothetical protein TELCIR_07295 [Teladorsagia circumcincta]|uniref:Uncharacterized protein n=1 Tax=Teladorsagia circumcincta TaxID=45464 RepID=A0A2G9UKP0_TELCI|nr:hypothetical protein TELCIR_07295 [Teladorsagia circumcincta]
MNKYLDDLWCDKVYRRFFLIDMDSEWVIVKRDDDTDDSGLFGIDVSLHATSTPLPHSPQPFLNSDTLVPPVPNPYADLGNPLVKTQSPVQVIKKSPPTPSSFKRAMRDVQRQGILQPRKLLVDDGSETAKRKRESSLSDSFEVPKKPLKPYSRRWMRLVTGGTRNQRDLTAAAHAFIARSPRFPDSW